MNFTNSFVRLGTDFYQTIDPMPVKEPDLFLWNSNLARDLMMPQTLVDDGERLARIFSGNERLPGSEPIAMAYAGHQFGNFVPQLGDGRAHLLGEVVDRTGVWRDIQLKGSGQTAFSRNGDGRCALGPAIREFIMSEAMHALGIATTRCLAVATTGEEVYRETRQPGAVVTRVAAGHLRVGTFELFAARQNSEALETLCNYAIERHYPDIDATGPERYLALIERVVDRQIDLIVDWLRVGFIHGVMNTDNTAISGETIDFGPCAMLGVYDLDTVYSSIDRQGRYAYGNQPTMAQWNMARFAEALLPLIDGQAEVAVDKVTPLIQAFSDRFKQRYWQMMAGKAGLADFRTEDQALLSDLLEWMQRQRRDYTVTFDRLTRSLTDVTQEAELSHELGQWYPAWRSRLSERQTALAEVQRSMRSRNPVVIPRNHHMEAVIEACLASGESVRAEEFLRILRHPYEHRSGTERFQDSPADGDRDYRTFCGT